MEDLLPLLTTCPQAFETAARSVKAGDSVVGAERDTEPKHNRSN
jgi:hypothetical protein